MYGIYRKYVDRACENLGVSGEENKDEKEYGTVSEYPIEFKKITPVERKKMREEFGSTEDFLSMFSGASVYKDLTISKAEDVEYGEQ